MSRPKFGIRLYTTIQDAYAMDIMKEIADYIGSVGILGGGGNIRRVINGDADGIIHADWYEIRITGGPIRSQHILPYTDCERPLEIEIKSTMRNRGEAGKLINIIESILSRNGAFVTYRENYPR